jgi:hypothetical protein
MTLRHVTQAYDRKTLKETDYFENDGIRYQQ